MGFNLGFKGLTLQTIVITVLIGLLTIILTKARDRGKHEDDGNKCFW